MGYNVFRVTSIRSYVESLQSHHDARLLNVFFSLHLLRLVSHTDHIVPREHGDRYISGKLCVLISGRQSFEKCVLNGLFCFTVKDDKRKMIFLPFRATKQNIWRSRNPMTN